MAIPMSPVRENIYDILMEDADGRRLCLDSLDDLFAARERLKFLAACYPQTRLVLCCHKTHTIFAETDGY
jgi:hypothetical protein